MKYFSGFCLCDEKYLFNGFLEKSEFYVAGFSYGAQKVVDYTLNSNKRIDKIQLFSPAFFDYSQKIIDLNLKAFKKNKNLYIKNFLTKAGIDKWKMENGKWKIDERNIRICECDEQDLYELFTFNWEKIKKLENIKIEVFLGEYDKIINLKKAYEFFKNYADVYLIKKANHFLRSDIEQK